MEIKQKTILITGAASGLGAATAKHLAKKGAEVVLADINKTQLDDLAVKLNAKTFVCDVTDAESVTTMLSSVGDVHGLVNCAGIVHAKRLVGKTSAMPLSDFESVIQINLIGTFNVMRLVAEKMSHQPNIDEVGSRGVIVNTASVAAFEGQVGQVAYSASKGAVASMTLPAARELSRFGIRVMTIAPGVMETPMMSGMPDKVQRALCADIPFPKKLGDANYFAQTVAHILENDYLNGSVIRLDAGLRLA